MTDDDWTDYESGPFCRHWSEASDCEEVCQTCGHGCIQHGFGDGSDTDCRIDECGCEAWT